MRTLLTANVGRSAGNAASTMSTRLCRAHSHAGPHGVGHPEIISLPCSPGACMNFGPKRRPLPALLVRHFDDHRENPNNIVRSQLTLTGRGVGCALHYVFPDECYQLPVKDTVQTQEESDTITIPVIHMYTKNHQTHLMMANLQCNIQRMMFSIGIPISRNIELSRTIAP